MTLSVIFKYLINIGYYPQRGKVLWSVRKWTGHHSRSFRGAGKKRDQKEAAAEEEQVHLALDREHSVEQRTHKRKREQ